MAFTYVNIEKLEDTSKKIIDLVNQYDIEITNLFKMLSNVPYETREWVGQSAQYYFKTISLDKVDFLNFGNNIRSFANKITIDKSEIEKNVAHCIANEATKGEL